MADANEEKNQQSQSPDPEVDAQREDVPAERDPESLVRLCDELKQERDQFQDRYQRALADLQNYQRRSARERQDLVERTKVDTIEQFLFPVIDDLDRAIQAGAEHGYDEQDALYAGLTMVHRRMLELLRQYGIEPIEAVGQPFDPLYHEALMHQPTDEYPENTVVQVVNRGYIADGKTIRPARVVVAKRPADSETQPQ
ncbi:MAG: nucleotide exchange factor GrpE [Phycisphaerae bacterium]|nr:nucleotide exchange factor GrpE [Phycisphaerae bacterium]